MRTLEHLSKEDKIFNFENYQVVWYRYLCVHPHNKEYHILMDAYEDPIRIYGPNLQKILDKGLNSYREAELALANHLEEKAKSLKEN